MPKRVQEATRTPRSNFTLSGRPVLLATDGSPSAAAATRMAQVLADDLHAEVHALVVLNIRSAPIPPPLDLALLAADEVTGPAVHAEQKRALRAGLAKTLGRSVDWQVRMAVGTPASAIVREATRIGAALIVIGLRTHGRVDRVLNDETTLNVIRTATCPVLGVATDLTHLPTRALVAVDFTSASLAAATTVRGLLAPDGKMTLAYVPALVLYPPDDGEGVIHDLGVNAGFERAERELAGKGVTVDHVILHHELKNQVSDMLLEYADSVSAEVIAAGSARLTRVDRWLLGSVSTDLIRDGRRSILVVPPDRPAENPHQS